MSLKHLEENQAQEYSLCYSQLPAQLTSRIQQGWQAPALYPDCLASGHQQMAAQKYYKVNVWIWPGFQVRN